VGNSKNTLFGPAILVTAAFIGPGTVLAASKAGAEYGMSLLWAVAFSVFSAIVLQEMAARLGIVTGMGLSQAIKTTFQNPFLKFGILALILTAILVGNAAYQTGNVLGAAAGLSILAEAAPESADNSQISTVSVADSTRSELEQADFAARPSRLWLWTLLVGGLALMLIIIGRFSLLQRCLTALVLLMSVLFLLAAFLSGPSLGELAGGLVPRIPSGSEWFVIGLIGTTVVPYNLFLHSSAAAQRWPSQSVQKTADKAKALKDSRKDTKFAILVGGVVTAAILVTAAKAFEADVDGNVAELNSVSDVAIQLEPALGSWAKWLFGAGLLAAGLTSAITAPIAAAYAAAGCFGWPDKLSDWRLKSVASIVVLVGMFFAIQFEASPKETIILAQVANGLLLPIVALFLLIILNRVKLMHRFRNSVSANVLGVIVLIVVTLIAARQLTSVYPKIKELWQPPKAVVELNIRKSPENIGRDR
jgi:manganese transport protein